MKKYTKSDFKKFEVIDGVKQCPPGDYSLILVFGERCRFGERCSFENGKTVKQGFPFLAIDGAGSANRKTYFFNTEEGVYVRDGCFAGFIDDFKAKVLEDVPETHIKAIQYLGFCEIVEKTFTGADPCN